MSSQCGWKVTPIIWGMHTESIRNGYGIRYGKDTVRMRDGYRMDTEWIRNEMDTEWIR